MRFESTYEVVVPVPVEQVFAVLGLADHVERVVRLSPIMTRFEILETRPGPTSATEVVVFEFTERVTVVPRLYAAATTMRVEQTADREALRVDYRSRSQGGPTLLVHKVRTFTPVDGGTRVTEVVQGDTVPGLHLIAGYRARQAHMDHMERYAGLFAE